MGIFYIYFIFIFIFIYFTFSFQIVIKIARNVLKYVKKRKKIPKEI